MPKRRTRWDAVADWSVQARDPAFGPLFTVAAFLVSFAARLALDPYLPPGYPFITFFPAIALTAFLAGPRLGTVLAVMCFLVTWYWFIAPVGTFDLSPGAGLALVLYLLVVGTEIGLVALIRRAMIRLRAAEAEAREQAKARALMFSELQHRVSNNLSVVSSLLTLQRRSLSDPAGRRALEDAARRIGIVARLNRLLHNPDTQDVDLAAFLKAMVPEAVAAAAVEARIGVEVSAEPVMVSADAAVPIGLIATELLVNAIEHGYPGEQAGRIAIALTHEQEGRAAITIQDDGVGLPPDFDLANNPSLGLAIARQFAEQLGARLSIFGDKGVVSRVEFPVAAAV